jgi:hypothetical protein
MAESRAARELLEACSPELRMRISAFVSILSCTSIAAAAERDGTVDYLPRARDAVTSADRERAGTPETNLIRKGDRRVVFADLGMSVAPVGAMLTSGVYFRRTVAADERGNFEAPYVQGGVALGVTPASFQPQAHVEYLPAPFLALRADFAATRYFGTNTGLLSFDSADADFSRDVLSDRRGDERAAWGFKGGISLLPRAKFGPLLILTKLRFTHYRYDEDDGPYVYEPELDTLLSTSDFVFSSHTDLLFQLYRGRAAESFLFGPMMESTRTIDTELSRVRVGGTARFVPAEQWANVRRPRLYATIGVNVDDPHRSGEPFALFGIGADME